MTNWISSAITADRQRLGMSQQELARLVGVSQQSVSKWEEGTAAPRGKRLAQLVVALGKNSATAEKITQVQSGASVTLATQQLNAQDMNTQDIQKQAAIALAQAAKQIALAAQALAESAQKLASATEKATKH